MKRKPGANILVVSGPSGSGKTTLIRRLLMEMPDLEFSVSHTTRERRPGEKQERDYHFVSREVFDRMIGERAFVEWADVHGQRYGTSWNEIQRRANSTKILVLDLDVQGSAAIRDRFPDSWSVFILPPSMKELKARLVHRESTLSNAMKKRLETAVKEIACYPDYSFVIVNKVLDVALESLIHIVGALENRTSIQGERLRRLMGEDQ